jgi:cytoskeletal protein CcmA (bactofilin family)
MQKLFGLTVTLILALTACLGATQFKSAENYTLPSDQRLEDDLIITGKNIKIEGEIAGDILSACRSASINGLIENSAFNASQYLTVDGHIQGSLISFCQDLNLSGSVGRNLTAFAAHVLINREAVVEGQLSVYAGELDLEGEVNKGLRAECDEIVISGYVAGDITIETEKLTILEGAVIEGDLQYKSPKEAKIDPHAKITGEIKWTERVKKDKNKGVYRAVGPFKATLLAANLVTGVILIALFRRRWDLSQKAISQTLLKSLGLGFVLAVCVPIAAIVLIITVLGIPLALMSIIAYVTIFYLAKLVFSTMAGTWLLKYVSKKDNVSLIWAFLLGYLLFWLISGFKVIGPILYILAFLVGFGGIVLGNKSNGKNAPATRPATSGS